MGFTVASSKRRKSALYAARCPICSAAAGVPCHNREGEQLPGVHFQRNTERRRAIAAAFYLYAPHGAAARFKGGI